MIINIVPIEINKEFADQLLIQVHQYTMTDSSCNVYYHLRDSKQTSKISDKTVNYKVLFFETIKLDGEDFKKFKQDESYIEDYIINKLKLEKV